MAPFTLKKTRTSTSAGMSAAVEDGIIEEFGYNATYRRAFKSIGSVALVLGVSSPMSAILIIAFYQVTFGGYWGLTWGWVIPSILFFSQPLAIAELCSAMPTNGAYYWWTAALAPRRFSRPFSYICGWVIIMTLSTSLASFSFACASAYTNLISQLHPEWLPTAAQNMGIAMAILLMWAVTASLRMERITILYISVSIMVLLATAAFVIGLPITHSVQGRRFTSGTDALGTYQNFSEWNDSVAVPFTFFGVAWVVTGWQQPAYVAEETQDARRVAPKAILTSFALTAVMGFLVCWICAFCIEDIEASAADPTGFPIYSLVLDHWGSSGGTAFLLVAATLPVLGGSALMLSSSSQLAAFARDGGLPFPDLFSYINPRTNTPIAGTIVLTAGTMLVLLFGLSPTAGPIIYSLAVICGLMMNGIPMCLRVYAGKSFVEGPFNYGRWSVPVHIFALLTIVWLIIMESFPISPNWTANTFNYNWAVALGVTLLATLAWFLHGSRAYKGPDLEAIEKFKMRRRGDGHSTISSDRIQVSTETESGKPHIDSRT